jgi:hypothetical protein
VTTPITQWAELARRFVDQAGKIVLQANTQVNDETFTTEKWAKSAQQLVNLTLTTAMEAAPLPCLPQSWDSRDLSEFIGVTPDSEFERSLSVVTSFVHEGIPSCVIPDQSIYFVPATLRVHATRFRIGVNWPKLRSGTYNGQIRLTQIGCATPLSVEIKVSIDL